MEAGELNDVWASADGITWTEMTASAAWPPRCAHISLVHDGRIWIMGGSEDSVGEIRTKNDVWSSSDGVEWTQVTASAPGLRRRSLTGVVVDGRMWVIGGRHGGVAEAYWSDVWSSTDGVQWTRATVSASWNARRGHTSVFHDGKLWVIGGADAQLKNDVWYCRLQE